MGFQRKNGELYCESIPLTAIAAKYGTPTYIYSRTELIQQFSKFDKAFKENPHLICFAVKANPSLAILNQFARLGSGFDIVSGGELQRVLASGGQAGKTVFSGVGKTETEIRLALTHGILCFNVESSEELSRINAIAFSMQKTAPVSLRVNPDVDAKTHPHISTGLKSSKFGVPWKEAVNLYKEASSMRGIRLVGMDCHIGSQLTDPAPIAEAASRIIKLVDILHTEGIELDHIDFGGGIGIRYGNESPVTPDEYVHMLLAKMGSHTQKILIEPGRALVGNAGVLLARIEYLKKGEDRRFAIIDAAMNDLMRPALYDAWHTIEPVIMHRGIPVEEYDVVGPVCETGDFLGKNRPLSVRPGDLVTILSAGAYGMSMSSNYNSRPRAAEVMVDGDVCHLIRSRETFDDLIRGELIVE